MAGKKLQRNSTPFNLLENCFRNMYFFNFVYRIGVSLSARER